MCGSLRIGQSSLFHILATPLLLSIRMLLKSVLSGSRFRDYCVIDDITTQKLHVCQQLLATVCKKLGGNEKKKWVLHTADFSD